MQSESLAEFYSKKLKQTDSPSQAEPGSFNVFNIEERMVAGVSSPTFIRRDFYKIMFYQGINVFHYGDESIPILGDTLLCFNPQVPYTYEPLTEGTSGYFCVFKEDFLNAAIKFNIKEHPLFARGAKPVFALSASQSDEVKSLFVKMTNELQSQFAFKYELIRSYVIELMFYALKLSPQQHKQVAGDAAQRITTVFTELLERQFPIESPAQRYQFRSPKDFADRLSVHVNYLNRAVKKVTGKTTSELIFERLTSEAKLLLRYTNWSVAEIGYALGFEDPAHFHHFFKKQTQLTPLTFRSV